MTQYDKKALENLDKIQRQVEEIEAKQKAARLAREAKDKLYNEQLAKSVPYRPGSKKVRSSITNLDKHN